uniref:Uncharacterized protein n=1 Tax=Cucumis melo TaxID=3656 RepID=A0A9I9E9U9_CUCME
MVSKANQVVLASFNPGNRNRFVMNFVLCGRVLVLSSDLSLVRKVGSLQFYLDLLRTTSKATTRYVTDTLLAIKISLLF